MEVARSSETLVPHYQTIQSCIAEYSNLYVDCCENLKSHNVSNTRYITLEVNEMWRHAVKQDVPLREDWYRLKQNVLCSRQWSLLVYLMSFVGVLAFMFTLTVGHIWAPYLTGGLFG
jgi:hypothetical protein